MRFTKAKQARGEMDIVITSLLDINFLLIMFFMTAAQFQMESRAELELPRERGEENAQPDEAGLVINITAEGDVIVSGRTVGLDELESLVKAQVALEQSGVGETLKLMVRADRNADTADLNAVVSLLRRLGVAAIRVGTHVPQ